MSSDSSHSTESILGTGVQDWNVATIVHRHSTGQKIKKKKRDRKEYSHKKKFNIQDCTAGIIIFSSVTDQQLKLALKENN